MRQTGKKKTVHPWDTVFVSAPFTAFYATTRFCYCHSAMIVPCALCRVSAELTKKVIRTHLECIHFDHLTRAPSDGLFKIHGFTGRIFRSLIGVNENNLKRHSRRHLGDTGIKPMVFDGDANGQILRTPLGGEKNILNHTTIEATVILFIRKILEVII